MSQASARLPDLDELFRRDSLPATRVIAIWATRHRGVLSDEGAEGACPRRSTAGDRIKAAAVCQHSSGSARSLRTRDVCQAASSAGFIKVIRHLIVLCQELGGEGVGGGVGG